MTATLTANGTFADTTTDTSAVAPTLFPATLRPGFHLDPDNIATEPPEAGRMASRDGVRLMISSGLATPRHTHFVELVDALTPGDVLVVNNSGTVAAAVDATIDGEPVVIHVSSELPGGLWMVEPRLRIDNGSTEPLALTPGAKRAVLEDGTIIDLLRPAPGSARLWLAVLGEAISVAPVDPTLGLEHDRSDGAGGSSGNSGSAVAPANSMLAVLDRLGRPIRYRYVPRDWPLAAYQTVFATRPGSAEMPSAARPFTPELVTGLVARGIGVTTITLHTGVSSLEGYERPYPERYEVPAHTAAAVNAAHAESRHVVAVGTTVVRALETAVDRQGVVHPSSGWTDLVISPTHPVRAVDGLLTGWHEPEASHLAMLEAVAGRDILNLAYDAAQAAGYRWHEFGDSHLLLPYDNAL